MTKPICGTGIERAFMTLPALFHRYAVHPINFTVQDQKSRIVFRSAITELVMSP